MGNAATLIGLLLQAATQAQAYSSALAKAAAEGRDVTDEELAAAKASAQAAIDVLASS